MDLKYKRIHILGPSGCGKTYLADKLTKKLNIKSYDLDDLFFKKKYNLRRDEKERNELLEDISKKKKWIIEGTYWKWISPSIEKANLVVWLDPNPYVLNYRLVKRHLLRNYNIFTKKNKRSEGWDDLIKLLKYSTSYRKMAEPNTGYEAHKWLINKHKVNFVHLKNKKEVNNLLEELI